MQGDRRWIEIICPHAAAGGSRGLGHQLTRARALPFASPVGRSRPPLTNGLVGARIVARVLVGLLAGDPNSFYAIDPTWVPELPNQGGGFQLRDLLVEAGMPMSDADTEKVMG